MKTSFLVFSLLAFGVQAQTIRVENFSPTPYTGWKRTTIDVLPQHFQGVVGSNRYVVGRSIGRETRVIDIHVTLAPGQAQTIDLSSAQPLTWTRGALPNEPLAYFGGFMTFAGKQMSLISLIEDGAGYSAHFRVRTGRMFCSNVWITWYPDQPAWAHGESILIASNPAVPDMTEVAPAGFDLRFGDALVLLPGRGMVPIVVSGTRFGDGQGRSTPLTFIWLRHMKSQSDWGSFSAAAQLGVCAVGISKLLPDGNPVPWTAGLSVRSWTSQKLPEAFRKLHTWEDSIVGPAKSSSITGRQEDQIVHPGAEAMAQGGVGAELIRYLAAIHLHSMRPSNHLEPDGSPLNLDLHPQLRFWDSRVHPSSIESPDRLGKPRNLDGAEANGAWGADTQHFLFNTLVASARLTGSFACQWLMDRAGSAYLLQRTLNGSTAGIWSAREVGYEVLWAVACHENMENRMLAGRIVQRCKQRLTQIILPIVASRDWIADQVNHWGVGNWWAPWEQSVAAYGMSLFAEKVGGVPGLRETALRLARLAVNDGWMLDGGQWKPTPMRPVPGSATPPAPPDVSFRAFGMPMCVWVVLKYEPANVKARAIWDSLSVNPIDSRFMPPGL